jgi:CheY-like chemotaxis protein
MDIDCPAWTGVMALEHLRADPLTAGITVVAMTASVMPIDRQRFARATDGCRCDSNGFHHTCSSRHSNNFPTKAL